jgi:uncharacterized protein YjbI with pentapeptide repeats
MNLAKAIFGSLNESFKDAQRLFVEQGGSPEEVKQVISDFKQARVKKTLKSGESDIGSWIKQGWEPFKTFVNELEGRTSGRQERKGESALARQEAIIHRDDDEWLVVTPLTERASIHFGSNTKWCTATTKTENWFDYYARKGLVLFYVLRKEDNTKWAATWSLREKRFNNFFDELDKKVSKQVFPYDLTPYATPEVFEAAGKKYADREKWLDDVRAGKVKDLQSAYLQGADLQGADLQGAYLQSANLQGAYLEGAYLWDAKLQGADLQEAYLKGANLQGANLQGADLQEAYLKGANLQGANLQGANLQGADLQGAYLQGANLQGADLQGAYLQGANLLDSHLQGANLQGADLQDADLQRANLKGANLQGAYLPFANLQEAFLQDGILQGADLRGANLLGADLRDVNLQGAELEGAKMPDGWESITIGKPLRMP